MWTGDHRLRVEETLTTAEKNLKDMGEHRHLRDTRMLFQYSKVPSFVAPVEQITGRRVRSSIPGIDTEEDISIGTFLSGHTARIVRMG